MRKDYMYLKKRASEDPNYTIKGLPMVLYFFAANISL